MICFEMYVDKRATDARVLGRYMTMNERRMKKNNERNERSIHSHHTDII